MSNTKQKPIGLRLTLGGAPDEWHTIPGLPGFYRPGHITPVGGPGEATEEQAREFAAKRSKVVELVDVKPTDLDGLRAAHHTAHEQARGNDTSRLAAPINDTQES